MSPIFLEDSDECDEYGIPDFDLVMRNDADKNLRPERDVDTESIFSSEPECICLPVSRRDVENHERAINIILVIPHQLD